MNNQLGRWGNNPILMEQYVRQAAEKDPFYRNIMERFDHRFNQEEKDIDKKNLMWINIWQRLAVFANQITPSGRTVGKLYFELVKRSNSSGSRSSTLAGVLSLHSSCICSRRPGAFCPPRTEVIPQ